MECYFCCKNKICRTKKKYRGLTSFGFILVHFVFTITDGIELCSVYVSIKIYPNPQISSLIEQKGNNLLCKNMEPANSPFPGREL